MVLCQPTGGLARVTTGNLKLIINGSNFFITNMFLSFKVVHSERRHIKSTELLKENKNIL
jgi:hypothetical protein